MCINDVLSKCKEKGYSISKEGLYKAGKKYGFIKKIDGKHHLEFDKEKFLSWLDKAVEEVPNGWMTVKELSEKFNVSLAQAYILIKDEESGARFFGSGAGVLYADPERIEKIIQKRENSHKVMWEE